MLVIENLHTRVEGKDILKGITLSIKPGEVHAIMGPNGSGKSTLAQVIAGREHYEITQGDITYKGKSIINDKPEMRARNGIFVAFQYPVEIPGVNNAAFLRTAVNAIRKHQGKEEIDAFDFSETLKTHMKKIKMNPEMTSRSVNEGFSGGEKKRNEILQMMLLDPTLVILDETDSGLDIDALRIIAEGVNSFKNSQKAILIITHYQRLLDYIQPDFIHVLAGGKILKSGGKELAFELEEKGYDWTT